MENEKIKAVEQWLKPKSIRNIQFFLAFANFYWQFIQGFIYIATPITLMLKTTGSTESIADPEKTKGKAGGYSMVGNNMIGGSEATN